jgi:hypothetical protein
VTDDHGPQDRPEADEQDRADELAAAARRRRRAAVFGEVLPESTGDERADWGERAGKGSEEWLRAQVPPHHG